MIINLYYVEGISVTDTPTFTHIDNQINYFKDRLIKSIETTYYPPHYNNKIRFSIDDINISDQVNYLSLNYNNKEYYYFIDSIHYINENVFELNISIDTIQSYMFNITILDGTIERMNIDRYNNDGTINRNYIRENVSNGIYETKVYNNAFNLPYLFIITTERFNNDYNNMSFTDSSGTELFKSNASTLKYLVASNSNTLLKSVDTNVYAYIVPLFFDLTKSFYLAYNNKLVYYKSSASFIRNDLLYEKLKGDSRVACMQVLNSTMLKRYINIDYDKTLLIDNKTCIDITNSVNNQIGIDILDVANSYYPCFTLESVNLTNDFINDFVIGDVNFNTQINKSIGKDFNINYIPQYIDENFVKFTFGESVGNTEYPLHLSNVDKFNLVNFLDIVNNSRLYSIQESDLNEFTNKYNIAINDNTSNVFALINDAWKIYQNQNSATLSLGNYVNVLTSTIKGYSKGGTLGGVLGGATTAVQQFIKQENIKNTPDTLAISNNAINNVAFNIVQPFYKIEIVNDLSTCLSYFERYGFKVDKIFNSKESSNYFTSRYYYNYAQFSNIDIKLNILSDQETINKIIERFKNGIRLWHVEHKEVTLHDYTYDNVETKYLKVGVNNDN